MISPMRVLRWEEENGKAVFAPSEVKLSLDRDEHNPIKLIENLAIEISPNKWLKFHVVSDQHGEVSLIDGNPLEGLEAVIETIIPPKTLCERCGTERQTHQTYCKCENWLPKLKILVPGRRELTPYNLED